MRTAHMLKKFMQLGTSVSPAPRNTPEATMEAAYIASAKASMRSTSAPSDTMAGSGDRSEIIHGAAMNMAAPETVITATPKSVVIQPRRRVRSWRPAPMLWPISVVAAAPMP